MAKLQIIAVAALAIGIVAPGAFAQRRSGGAVSSGVRGAAVGGLVGGSSGAATGAKIGVVTGATRSVVQGSEQRRAMDAEAQSRSQYQSSADYQSAQYSNYYEAPPQVMVTATPDGAAAPSSPVAAPKDGQPVETVIRKEGKPVLGITYPADWKQKAGDRFVTAVSADGHGWSVLALMDGVKDKQAGIAKAKQQLEKTLLDINYDKPTETERGALMVTGTGKGKKNGVDVVFAMGVFESAPGRLAGTAFIVDKALEDHYKETVRFICQTIRGEKDFTAAKDAAK